MIASLSGGEGLAGAAAFFAQQAQTVSGPTAVSSLTGGEGGGSGVGSSASISGPGQLLSDLAQLQSTNPTQFTQVATQIADQVQTAAQQAQGPQSNFLASLAAKFQSVASSGDLSSLQPQQTGSIAQTYSLGTQHPSQGITGFAQPTNGNANLQQLFSTISNEVKQALVG